MSLENPRPSEIVIAFGSGVTIIEGAMVAVFYKCFMRDRQEFTFLVPEGILDDILSMLTEEQLLKNAKLIDEMENREGKKLLINDNQALLQHFEMYQPEVTQEDANNPPIGNGVVFCHQHIFPEMVALDTKLHNGKSKLIVFPLVIAGIFRSHSITMLEEGRRYLKNKYGGRA
jgi:hypothetical protein